jgi:NAD(P)-dependent dehydrogenase (short-subunit alcohol dehydrogenase family)
MQKTVLITGCSSGFGLSLTKLLLREGWKVIATVRHQATSHELNELQHPSLKILQLDVTIAADRTAVTRYIDTELDGNLHCLINNAGYGLFGPLEELTEEQIRHQLEVNVFGVILLTQQCLVFLRKVHGRIINISSVFGYVAFPLQSLYVTSKFALEGFTESLYYELAPHGIQVALVEPGSHSTRFGKNAIIPPIQNAMESYDKQKSNFIAFRKKLMQRKNGSPETLSNCVLALLNKRYMPLRVRVGKDARSLYVLKRLLPAHFFNQIMRAFFKKTLGAVDISTAENNARF